MTIARRKPQPLYGSPSPRITPPLPARSLSRLYAETAESVGIHLMPHQVYASRFLTATGRDGWLYREIAVVMARQNGKTELLIPRIIMDLRAGKRIIHTAQNRILPRQVYFRVARALPKAEIEQFRQANGQEILVHRDGGSYMIVAPQRGARGLSADTLIFDELREFEDFDIIGAASPTLTASSDPQSIYLSNAGTETSVVLNDLRRRGEEGGDAEFAYLEWSASQELAADDRTGWLQANPAIGHLPRMLDNLEVAYRTKPPAEFDTEHLCRWVASMRPRLVPDAAWQRCRVRELEAPLRPAMGISMDPSGRRASALLAWQQADGTIGLKVEADVHGDPIDTDRLGRDLKERALRRGVSSVSYGSWTDGDLARYFANAKPLDGKEYANASVDFARNIDSGRLRWDDASQVSDDLAWTARKPHESGAWMAVKAKDDRPITAVLAAIRAVWLASGPKPQVPRVL